MSISMKRYNDTIITPKDDRILFDQIFDDYGLIYGGSATMAASNKIHVGAARGFIKGTEVIVEAEDIAVNLSDSGTKNGRLKIVMDLADTETPIKFESEVAASFPALEQDANINYDNGRYEVVFATYKATETTISSVALVMPTMQSVKAKIQGINQSLTNLNDSKKTYLRLVLPNLAADAKTVCDYINKNYLMGQITPMYSIEFDVVASNVDWFSGVLSTDTNVDSNARTVLGIVQQRSISADNSTLYKYFASGTGGVGSVSALDHVKSFIDVSTILKSYTTIAAGATVTYVATRDCFVNVAAYAHGSGQNTKIYIDNVHVFNPYTNNGDNAGLMIVDKTVPLKTGQTIKIENGTYTTSSYAIFAAF
mgnify:FL=1